MRSQPMSSIPFTTGCLLTEAGSCQTNTADLAIGQISQAASQSLGLTSIHMVKRRREKGEVAKSLGITICIDDAYECVHSMALACYPNWQLGILFGGRPSPQGSPHDDWVLASFSLPTRFPNEFIPTKSYSTTIKSLNITGLKRYFE